MTTKLRWIRWIRQVRYSLHRHCSPPSPNIGRAVGAALASSPDRPWLRSLWWGYRWWLGSAGTGLLCCWDILTWWSQSPLEGTSRSGHVHCSSESGHSATASAHLERSEAKQVNLTMSPKFCSMNWFGLELLGINASVKSQGHVEVVIMNQMIMKCYLHWWRKPYHPG